MKNETKEPCRDWLAAIEALAEGGPPALGLLDHLEACPACKAYSRRLEKLDALVAETSSSIEDPGLTGYARPRRVSKPKVVLSAFALVLFGAVLAFAVYGSGILSKGRRGDDGSRSVASGASGRDGAAPVASDRQSPAPSESPSHGSAGVDPAAVDVDAEAPAETLMATAPGERLVETPEPGVIISLSEEGHAVFQKSGEREWFVRLENGLLVVRVERTQPATRMTVDARNMSVHVKGTLLSVRATDGIITEVDVEEGSVEIRAKTGEASLALPAGMRMTSLDLPAEPRAKDAPKLADQLLPAPAAKPAAAGASASVPATAAGATGAAKASSKAASPAMPPPAETGLSAYDQAMALRKACSYEDAVNAFIAAADASSGLTRERCFYQAVELSLTKLKDHDRAVALAESYLAQFPDGFYAEEILMMKAKALMGQSKFEEARAVLAQYIDAHPEGSQATLAHLLLGKILATTFENCKAAVPHLGAVISDNPKGAKADQARKILGFCGVEVAGGAAAVQP